MRKLQRAALAAVASVPLLILGTLAGAGSVSAASAQAPVVGPRLSTDSNWAGYATYGSAGPFTSAAATWVLPKVTCSSQTAYSSYWVGLDGYNTSTVEQLGTEADCVGGSARYSAWYEMYPRRSYSINMTVKAGDSYTASVAYQGSGNFLLTLTDNTTGSTFHTNQKLNSAKRASAEAIVEAPWSGGTLPLANFGTANFSGARANGSPLGGFSPLDPITMDNPYGMVATPSKFQTGNLSFSVTWSAS